MSIPAAALFCLPFLMLMVLAFGLSVIQAVRELKPARAVGATLLAIYAAACIAALWSALP